MDALARRGHTHCLRRAYTASPVRGEVTGAEKDDIGSCSRVGCIDNPKARPWILAVEGGAPSDRCRARCRTRLPRGKPTRTVEAWRGGWTCTGACGSERSCHHLQPAAALPSRAAVREHEWRPDPGVLLRRSNGGVTQFANAYQ